MHYTGLNATFSRKSMVVIEKNRETGVHDVTKLPRILKVHTFPETHTQTQNFVTIRIY